MTRKEIISYFICILLATSCFSQETSEENDISKALRKKIDRIEFSKLVFFENELIEICRDTSIRSKFSKRIKEYEGIKRKTAYDQQEFEFTLHLIYKEIMAAKVKGADDQKSKNYLLTALNKYKDIKFSIDDSFILAQIDESKRGLGHGYDEGVTSESRFLFFYYDPVLLTNVMKRSQMNERFNRMGIFLCNYLRDNENPMALRSNMHKEVKEKLYKLKNFEGFDKISKDFNKCDITTNLFD